MGLIEVLDDLKAQGHERLFPELKCAAKGVYYTRASRSYGKEFLRPEVGITNPTNVFHSFRLMRPCRACGVVLHTYLTHVLTKLPQCSPNADITALLPFCYAQQMEARTHTS